MTAAIWGIEFLATFTEWFTCTIFCGTFIKDADLRKNLNKRIIISLVLSIIVIGMNNIEIFSPVTSIITFLLAAVSQLILYNKNKIKAAILACFFCLVYLVIDIIVIYLISYALKISLYNAIEKESVYRLISIICSKSLLIVFTVTINKLFSKNNNIKKSHILYLFVLTLIMSVLNYGIIFADINNRTSSSYVSVLFSIIMFILIMVIFLGAIKLTEYYENKEQLNLTKFKNEMLEQSMKETENTFMLWKNSLHDYKHNIMSLMVMANNGDLQSIKDYLENENDLLGKRLFYYKSGNETVDAILYIKQKIAENNNIPFLINAKVPENCNISNEHFASVLGNLLDNAIEASLKVESPFVEVKMRDYNGYFWIIVTNKCTGSDISLETSKKDKHLHGIGLKSVRHTIKAYDGELIINNQNEKFEVKIIIPDNKSV